MKIGTLSLNINTPDYNYGAMLHSYAFLKFLEKYDFIESAEVIDYITQSVLDKKIEIKIPEYKKRNNFRDKITLMRMKYSFFIRDKKFKKFVKDNMNVSSCQYKGNELKDAKLDYDCLICESDVIWSSLITGGKVDPAFFLSLPNMTDKLKIAYSPSLGDGIVDVNHEKDIKKYIKSLDYISCRESYAVDILKKYTSKPVTHVLDPVMLLDETDYNEIISKPLVKEKYILLYLPVNNNSDLRKHACEYAQKYNYKIIEISTKLLKGTSKIGKIIPDAGIEEFLSLLKYSECIFTNSFHAVCFSVLFKKEFYAFSRKYAGKVKDFCNVMKLSNRYFGDNNFIEQKAINYDRIYKNLSKLRKTSIDYIENALQNK